MDTHLSASIKKISILHIGLKWLTVFLLSLGNCFAQSAKTQGSEKEGVWEGRLGKQAITVCFSEIYADGHQTGVYFYKQFLNPIRLDANSAVAHGFSEKIANTNKAHQWQFAPTAQPDSLHGTWTNTLTKQTLPIELKRKALQKPRDTDIEKTACSNPAFMSALEKLRPLQKEPPKYFDGKAYQVVKREIQNVGKVEYIQILEAAPNLELLNKNLIKTWPFEDLINCQAVFISIARADYSHTFNSIHWWTKRWLVIDFSGGGDCGGAHPFNYVERLNYDLNSGKEVQLNKWFTKQSKHYQDSNLISASASLHERLLKKMSPLVNEGRTPKERKECLESLKRNRDYGTGLSAKGIRFASTLPRVSASCDQDVLLTYQEVKPYLSTLGLLEVEEILQTKTQGDQ